MKITIRLIIALVLTVTAVVAIFSYVQVQNERERLTQELRVRSAILAESLEESVKGLFHGPRRTALRKFIDRFANRERLVGLAVYDSLGTAIVVNAGLHADGAASAAVMEAIVRDEPVERNVEEDGQSKYLYVTPIRTDGRIMGALLLQHDASYIASRLHGIWQTNFFRLLTQVLLIVVTTVVIIRWSITGPIANVAAWMKGLRTGKPDPQPALPQGDILGPLTEEVSLLAKSVALARAASKDETRSRTNREDLWTADRLKERVQLELDGKNLVVVSNREPYMHVRQGDRVECLVPAGGLVTAIDPVLQAVGGVWIANGSGDADHEMADAAGCLPVPPGDPRYTLRRVYITKEEEEGYYYGFSNEGLWPLCHITHTRPEFRLKDWICYQQVNAKFAEVVLDQIAGQSEPLVLVQDYQFALLPLLIKSKRPDARVAIFWHIPWPNPEIFGICPWKQEILLGLLGADLVGFHIQFHCNNFLETVDRFLESRINWDQFTVEKRGSTTFVKPFPISVAFPERGGNRREEPEIRESVAKEIGMDVKHLAVGVDRIDYTKGIVERLRAVERFLEKYPRFIGEFVFVELAAPSRTHIKRYHDLLAEVEETVEQINWKYHREDWKPIVFLKGHHGHQTITPYYRAAQICMVTSLHDGMNLVAKEFVAARDDEDGVLILSQFTGAARELQDAIIINPYDVESTADAIHSALTMSAAERHDRMRRMRDLIRERNVYRWAGSMISSLSRLRLPRPETEKEAEIR